MKYDPRDLAEWNDIQERLREECKARAITPNLVDSLLDPENYFASTGRLIRGKVRAEAELGESPFKAFLQAAANILE
jgi:hypothetical protein